MSHAPRILHVTTVPQSLHFLTGHVEHAQRKGMDVHVASSPGEDVASFLAKVDVPLHQVAMSRRITPLNDLGALLELMRVIRKVRPTIVHGHTPKGGLLAMMAAKSAGVPVRIYHMYGLPLITARGLKRRLLTWAEQTSCRLAHQVFCLCNSLRDVVTSMRLGAAEKIKVLNHGNIDGVDAIGRFNPHRLPEDAGRTTRAKYGIPANALVMGFAGRIVRDKGLIELVGAWRLLREEFPSLHLLVAGTFEDEDPIPREVEAALRSDPRIHLAGQVRDMPSVYRALDVFVLPTYREGFGTVFIEASAMELPVVGTKIPGCVDAVRDGETGILVPVQEAMALAGAVRQYLRDPELRRRHGLCGRERAVRDFNPEIMRETLYQEYMRLLDERKIRH
jgi:glycosyltransferase involved in cell wall biosynthesis